MWFWCRERREAENTAADRAIISFTQKIQITQKIKQIQKHNKYKVQPKPENPCGKLFLTVSWERLRAECEVF